MKRKRWIIFGAACLGIYYAVTLTHEYVLPYAPTGDYGSIYVGWLLALLTATLLVVAAFVVVVVVCVLAQGLWRLIAWLRGK